MTIDWNWFFSAFAQCSAALIGIIAAFTISKLLSEGEKVEDHTNIINEMLLKRVDLLKRIDSRYFDWHDRLHIEYSFDLKEAIENGNFSNMNNEKMLDRLHSIVPNLFGVENCLDYLTKRINSLEPERTPIGKGISIVQQPIMNFNIPPEGMWDRLREERESIQTLRLESENLIECLRIKKLEVESKSKNTDPIKVTIYILMICFILTVIYPLHFMPISANGVPSIELTLSALYSNLVSIKGLFLMLLAITINGLFVYFLSLIIKIQKQYKQIYSSITPDDLNLLEYSKYFR